MVRINKLPSIIPDIALTAVVVVITPAIAIIVNTIIIMVGFSNTRRSDSRRLSLSLRYSVVHYKFTGGT